MLTGVVVTTELSWALAIQQPVAQQDQMDGCYHHSHGSFRAHEVPPTCSGHQCLSCIWCCTTCLKHPPATIHAASERVKLCSPSVLSVCPALSICPGELKEFQAQYPLPPHCVRNNGPASGFLTHSLLAEGPQGAKVSASRCCVPVSWDGTLPGHGCWDKYIEACATLCHQCCGHGDNPASTSPHLKLLAQHQERLIEEKPH